MGRVNHDPLWEESSGNADILTLQVSQVDQRAVGTVEDEGQNVFVVLFTASHEGPQFWFVGNHQGHIT